MWGIKSYTKSDGMLHVRLLQHRTATGRFSGADPNMQNMPRGGTFPVKKYLFLDLRMERY